MKGHHYIPSLVVWMLWITVFILRQLYRDNCTINEKDGNFDFVLACEASIDINTVHFKACHP